MTTYLYPYFPRNGPIAAQTRPSNSLRTSTWLQVPLTRLIVFVTSIWIIICLLFPIRGSFSQLKQAAAHWVQHTAPAPSNCHCSAGGSTCSGPSSHAPEAGCPKGPTG